MTKSKPSCCVRLIKPSARLTKAEATIPTKCARRCADGLASNLFRSQPDRSSKDRRVHRAREFCGRGTVRVIVDHAGRISGEHARNGPDSTTTACHKIFPDRFVSDHLSKIGRA